MIRPLVDLSRQIRTQTLKTLVSCSASQSRHCFLNSYSCRKKKTEFVEESFLASYQDSVPEHSALSEKAFLAKHSILMLNDSPYMPDVVACDFHLSPMFSSELKGTRFKRGELVKSKAAETLTELSKEYIQHCFTQRKNLMERCRNR